MVGGGGREHALCWALRRENPDAQLYCAPGNPGTAELATNLPVAADDLDRLADAADMQAIDLTIVGPEAPLALGLADRLRAEGRLVVGPSAAAAQIEASKAFAKEVLGSAGVRTAPSRAFNALGPALEFIEGHPEPLVVKASGLAAGKGAIVCASRREAAAAARAMLEQGQFGDAGRTVVVEGYLEGEEVSVMALTDGVELVLLPAAQDHKRLLDGDRGPNTGGMGAYSPVALASPALLERVKRDVFLPTLEELQRRRTPFSGVLYAGLMIDRDGVASVVEFNCRLGDPEAQVVLPLISEGLTDSLMRVAAGQTPSRINLSRAAAVTTVLAAPGYPDHAEQGGPVTIPDSFPENVLIFHAGTTRGPDNRLRVSGGRVLAVTGMDRSFPAAQRLSREAAESVEFPGKQFRRDIGWREAARLEDSRLAGTQRA